MKTCTITNVKKFSLVYLVLLLKIIWFHFLVFGSLAWTGVVAEGLSILALYGLIAWVLPIRRKGIVYQVLNIVFSLIWFAAALYYAHFGTFPTYHVLTELNQVPQIRGSIHALLRPEQFVLFLDFVLVLLWISIKHGLKRHRGAEEQLAHSVEVSTTGGRRARMVWNICLAVVIAFSLVSSGYSVYEGNRIDNELLRAERIGLLNYQAEAILRTHQENQMIAEGNIQETIRAIHDLKVQYFGVNSSDNNMNITSDKLAGLAQGMNLIVIQLESFQRFPIHLQVGGQEVTPILNQLAEEGVYFPHIFQQIGPGNTSDAEFMLNTSIYPTAAVAMSKGYGNRELPSLPRLLQGDGYTANTFHINNVSFWNRNQLYPALHFDQYYDKPYYNNDYFNDFGASDEEMYRVGVHKLTELTGEGKSWYAQFVTTSSHSPFIIPEDQRRLKLPPDLDGTALGHYLTAVNYTDYAIGQLIEYLKDHHLYDHTMLAIYGDHFGIQPSDITAEEIQTKLGVPYHDVISRFNIPFILYVPGQNIGITSERTGGQVDMLPTIANLLGIDLSKEGFTAMGMDLLNTERNAIGIRYYLPTGSFVNDEVLFTPGQGFDDGTAISLDTFQKVDDVSRYREDYDYVTHLMKLSDEYVKLLPKRGK